MEYRKFNREEYNRWVKDRGDQTHRIEYNINENSIVIDGGGYRGGWSEVIANRYNPTIYIFEPIKKYFDLLVKKFENNDKIHVIQNGISNKETKSIIYHSSDASSVFGDKGESEEIEMISLVSFMVENDITSIDLIKINIEGGEYDLLEDLIKRDMHERIKDIQVQFHVFVPECTQRREYIRSELEKTHKLTYDYEFIWENWERK